MKVSVLSSMASQDFRAAIRFAAERGLDGLDLDRIWGHPIERIAASGELDPLRRVLTGDRIPVVCLATNLFHGWIDSDLAFQEDMRRLEGCLRLTEMLQEYQNEAPIIRCYAFLRTGSLEEHWPILQRRLRLAADLATQRGFVLGIQNDAQTFLGTGREVALLLDSIGSEHLKAVWDPCAAVFDVDRPEIPYPHGYQRLRRHIVHVMLRDVDRRKFFGSFREVEFGEGLIDHRRQIEALMADGYQGAVTLATEWHPGMAYDQSPDMADFSEAGGQEAIRICLDNLRAMIARV